MDTTVAAILSAGIPAAIAAITFAIAEIIKVRRARSDQISAAVSELTAALAWIATVEGRPWPVKQWHYTQALVRSTTASAALLATVRPRDRIFAYWITRSSQTMIGPADNRIEWAAKTSVELRLWQMNPSRSRRRARLELGDEVPRRLLPWYRRITLSK